MSKKYESHSFEIATSESGYTSIPRLISFIQGKGRQTMNLPLRGILKSASIERINGKLCKPNVSIKLLGEFSQEEFDSICNMVGLAIMVIDIDCPPMKPEAKKETWRDRGPLL